MHGTSCGRGLILSRWDDDVVFKNQARGTEDKRKKEFVNVRKEQHQWSFTGQHG